MEEKNRKDDKKHKFALYIKDSTLDIAKELGLTVLAVEHRVKEERSLAGKLERKGDAYNSLEDITDILGCRVVCFLSDEIGKGDFVFSNCNGADLFCPLFFNRCHDRFGTQFCGGSEMRCLLCSKQTQ